MSSRLQRFVARKLTLAAALDAKELDGSYGDAILVVSSVLSSLAAQLWPGPGIDRVRFAELWQLYAPPSLHPTAISVPLLIHFLRENGDLAAATALEATNRDAFSGFPEADCLVITGPDVDQRDIDILSLCPQLPPRLVREHSYPAIFYEHVRSAYVHEYEVGRGASPYAMAFDRSTVSYVNNTPRRHIHFPLQWLDELTRGVAVSIEPLLARAPLTQPCQWWLKP